MRGLPRLMAAYLAIGALWCLVANLYAGLVGTSSAFGVLQGTLATTDKVFAVARILGSQVLLWPVDFYQTVLRPLIG